MVHNNASFPKTNSTTHSQNTKSTHYESIHRWPIPRIAARSDGTEATAPPDSRPVVTAPHTRPRNLRTPSEPRSALPSLSIQGVYRARFFSQSLFHHQPRGKARLHKFSTMARNLLHRHALPTSNIATRSPLTSLTVNPGSDFFLASHDKRGTTIAVQQRKRTMFEKIMCGKCSVSIAIYSICDPPLMPAVAVKPSRWGGISPTRRG